MHRSRFALLTTVMLLGIVSSFAGAPRVAKALAGDTITRVSVSSDGTQGNGLSGALSLSNDGAVVAFVSGATNLVPGDTNAASDIFVHEVSSATTSRVSIATGGAQGSGASTLPSISAAGRYIAFHSAAANLVTGDTNAATDVFRHDRTTGATIRVDDVFSGTQPNDDAYDPALSADGRYAAIYSFASNLVANDSNNTGDIFYVDFERVFDIRRVSVSSTGTQGNSVSTFPSMSGNGNVVAFESFASNLVLSDTNSTTDIFSYDVVSNQIRRVSVASNGTEGNGASYHAHLSADGSYIVFTSIATNLVPGDTNNVDDIFLHHQADSSTIRVSVASDGSQANGHAREPWISGDGRYVVFHSDATNLVPGDTNNRTDVFLRDLLLGTTTRLSVANDGAQGNGFSLFPVISANGQVFAFESEASNLVPGDTNAARDAFRKATTTGTVPHRTFLTIIFSTSSGGTIE